MAGPLDKDAIEAAARRLRAALDKLPASRWEDRDGYELGLCEIRALVENEGGQAKDSWDVSAVRMHGLRATSTSGLASACRNWLVQAAAKAGVTA